MLLFIYCTYNNLFYSLISRLFYFYFIVVPPHTHLDLMEKFKMLGIWNFTVSVMLKEVLPHTCMPANSIYFCTSATCQVLLVQSCVQFHRFHLPYWQSYLQKHSLSQCKTWPSLHCHQKKGLFAAIMCSVFPSSVFSCYLSKIQRVDCSMCDK